MKYRAFLPFLLTLALLAGSLLLAACGEMAAPTMSSMPLPTTGMMSMAITPAQQPLDVTPQSGPTKIIPGAMAPDFAVTDIDGQPLKLSEQGKAVIINYWSVYCDYCKEEMPALVKTYQANQDKLNIIGIDINDQPGEVRDFINQLKVTYPIVIDNTGDMVYKYRVVGRPTSIFINKDGVITGVVPGMATPDVLQDQLARVLQ
jgi:peroxiredoxin